MSFCKIITLFGRYVLALALIIITNAQLSGQCLELSDSLYRAAETLYTNGQMPVAGKMFMRSAEIESACPGGTYENISGALSNAAVCFEADNDFKNADSAYRILKGLAQKEGDTATIASAYLSLSRYAMSEVRFVQATAYADTSLSLFAQSGDRKGQVEAVELIADQLIFHGMYDDVVSLISPLINNTNSFDKSEINLFYLKIATVYKKANIPDSAVKYYSLVLDYEQSVNSDAAGEYAFVLGECNAQLGKKAEALRYYQLSYEIYTRNKNNYGKAVSLSLCGRTLSGLGRSAEGLQKLAQAQQLFAQEGYQEGVSSALMSMGSIFDSGQRLDSAYLYYSYARNIATSTGDSFLANKILGLISDMYYRSGDYVNAERIYKMALSELSEQQFADRSAAYNGLGMLYQRLGRDEDAMACLTEAHKLAVTSGDYLMMGQAYFSKGNYDYESGNYGDALLSFRSALDTYSRIRSVADVIATHDKMGQIFFSLGQYRDALVSLRTAQEMAMHVYDKQSAGMSCISIAKVFERTGMQDSASVYLGKAIALYRQIGRRDLQVNAFIKMAQQKISIHKYAEALEYLDECLAILQSLAGEAQASAQAQQNAELSQVYQLMSCAHLGLAQCPQAFNYREAASATDQENAFGKQLHFSPVKIDILQSKLSKDRAAIIYSVSSNADAYVMYVGPTESVCVKLQTERFAKQILADSSSKKIALDGIMRLGNALPKELMNASPSLDAPDALSLVGGFVAGYISLVARQGDALEQERHFSRMLYDYMLKPIELIYSGRSQLVFSCDSVFMHVAFESLLTGDSVLIAEKHSVRYAQSFSLAEYLNSRSYGASTSSIADFSVIAPLVMSCKLGEKPVSAAQQGQARRVYLHTPDKAQMSKLYNQFGYTNTLASNRMNESVVQGVGGTRYADIAEGSLKSLSESGQLAKYRFIHFSLPGIAIAGVPELAALMLLPGGGDDGFLSSNEVAGLRLRADLVSLSGYCSPSRNHSGGTFEIAAPFYVAGAKALLVSQWPVDGQFVSVFMQAFYRNAETCNNDFAEALFKTRNEFISGTHGFAWSLPYFWATFVLQGAM